MIRIFRYICFFFVYGFTINSYGQKELPPCKDSDSTKWTNCFATQTIEGGAIYEGGFVNGKQSGQGTVTLLNGATYVGGFKDGVLHGDGIATYPGGNKYVGEYRNGSFNGRGIYYFANGKKYDGEFKDGKMSGSGILIMQDGSEYIGEFQNNNINGQGTFKYKNGNKYVGEFKEGNIAGKGILTFANGDPSQEGIWLENKFIRSEKINTQPLSAAQPESANNQKSTSMVEAKRKCADLGFKSGTDGFGKCVLQLSR